MKRLAPFFSYYGSKHRIARRYPPPVTGHIMEPFAGSAAYACCYPHLPITLVEANPKIAAVWEYLIRVSESEVLALPLVDHDTPIAELPLPQEARWLLALWCNRGTSNPTLRPAKWVAQYPERMNCCQFWGVPARYRVARQVRYVRHWRVVSGSYETAGDFRADWFVDPPYNNAAGAHYGRFGSRKLDYTALAEWCLAREGQVIVCENEGADWLPFQPFTVAGGTHGYRRTGISREVIWHRSDEPPVQASLFDCVQPESPSLLTLCHTEG